MTWWMVLLIGVSIGLFLGLYVGRGNFRRWINGIIIWMIESVDSVLAGEEE